MARDTAEVALDAFHAAAARADGPALWARFDPDGVFLGTDGGERWQGEEFRAFLDARFAGGRGWTMEPVRRALIEDGAVAWFDEDLEHERLGALRGSGVLRRGADGRWRVAQYNLALTVPNEHFEAVRALIDG